MIKKCIIISVAVSSLLHGVSNENSNKQLESELKKNKSRYNYNLSIYGAGEKISDTSYKGLGVKFDSDYSEIVIEKGDDYKKGALIQRIDMDKMFYSKIGLGYLKREEVINEILRNINQTIIGGSIGYGNEVNYNLEIGYVAINLSNAENANNTAKLYFTEAVFKEYIDSIGSIDATFSYQYAKVYDKKISDYTGSIGYYPIDDIRLATKYSTIDYDNDNYRLTIGLNYKFDSINFTNGKFSPTALFSRNTSKNLAWVVEYKKAIANRSLKMRDKFEELINTTQIVAKELAPQEYENRNNHQNNSATNNTPIAEVQRIMVIGGVAGNTAIELLTFMGRVLVIDNSTGAYNTATAVAGLIAANSAGIISTWNTANPTKEIASITNPNSNIVEITYKITEGDVPLVAQSIDNGVTFPESIEIVKGN